MLMQIVISLLGMKTAENSLKGTRQKSSDPQGPSYLWRDKKNNLSFNKAMALKQERVFKELKGIIYRFRNLCTIMTSLKNNSKPSVVLPAQADSSTLEAEAGDSESPCGSLQDSIFLNTSIVNSQRKKLLIIL